MKSFFLLSSLFASLFVQPMSASASTMARNVIDNVGVTCHEEHDSPVAISYCVGKKFQEYKIAHFINPCQLTLNDLRGNSPLQAMDTWIDDGTICKKIVDPIFNRPYDSTMTYENIMTEINQEVTRRYYNNE